MATITLEIPDSDIEEALAQAAEGCGFKLADGFKVEDILAELTIDINTYVTSDFAEFFSEGIADECYTDVLGDE